MFIWNKLLKIKDTEENHITEAKNRLNYLKWIIKKIREANNSGKINVLKYAKIYDTLVEEQELLEKLL